MATCVVCFSEFERTNTEEWICVWCILKKNIPKYKTHLKIVIQLIKSEMFLQK